jgi:hypothetical protein
MPGTGTQYQSPMILQLFKNHEEQRVAEAQINSEKCNHGLQLLESQSTERVNFDPVMQWVGVLLRLFSLSLVSGSLLLVFSFALKLAGY